MQRICDSGDSGLRERELRLSQRERCRPMQVNACTGVQHYEAYCADLLTNTQTSEYSIMKRTSHLSCSPVHAPYFCRPELCQVRPSLISLLHRCATSHNGAAIESALALG